jgi:hypothetical protein
MNVRFYPTGCSPISWAHQNLPLLWLAQATRPCLTQYQAFMAIHTPSDAEHLRAEIAAAAARMIAEDGADYASAKRKAAKLIIGNQKIRGDVLPDNAQVEAQVREYQALFFGESQPQRLRQLRLIALELMEKLSDFSPWLTGAVLNGTAGEHSDIHLLLFADNSKDVAVFLLNANIDYEVSESNHFRHPARYVETLSFLWKHEGVHLSLYDPDDLRGAGRKFVERADLAGLRALLAEEPET